MNLVNIKQSILLKNDRRKHVRDSYLESFTSSVTHNDVTTFSEVSDIILRNGGHFRKPSGALSVIALPLTGGVHVQTDHGFMELNAEQIMFIPACSNIQFQTLEYEAVNLVLFSIHDESTETLVEIHPIGITKHDELIVSIAESFHSKSKIGIGVFKSRSETTYSCFNRMSEILIFVINGSFEVEGRLIEHRDSLVLWNKETIELEALADDSIVCIIENIKQ